MQAKHYHRYFSCEDCLFRSISCQFIDSAEFEKLQNKTIQLRFRKGETILKQGAKSHNLVFLRSGIIKFNYEDDRSKNLILSLNKAPALLGGANVLNEDFNLFSVVAVEDCECCLIDSMILTRIAMNNPLYLLKMLQFITENFRNSIFNFISLAHKQVNGRVADILLFLSRNIYLDSAFTLSLSRQEVAEFAGCSKENVIHTLRKFHHDEVIRIEGKKIRILDMNRLDRISKNG